MISFVTIDIECMSLINRRLCKEKRLELEKFNFSRFADEAITTRQNLVNNGIETISY